MPVSPLDRRGPAVAWALVATTVLLGGGLLVAGAVRSGHAGELLHRPFALVLPLCAALVLNQQPRNQLGWVMLVSGVALVAGSLPVDGRLEAAGPGRPSVVWAWLPDLLWPASLPLLLSLGLLLFPDGLPSPRWRPAAGAGLVGVALLVVSATSTPWGDREHGYLDNPLGPVPVAFLAYVLGQVCVLVAALAGVVAGVVRYRSGDPRTRAQLRLLLLVAVGVVLSVLALWLVRLLGGHVPDGADAGLAALVLVGYPTAIAVALVRHRLFDLDVIVHRGAVGMLSVSGLAVLYGATVTGIDVALAPRAEGVPAFTAAFAVALAFQPLVRRARALVDSRLFGSTGDPLRLLSAIGAHTQDPLDTDGLSAALAEFAQTALRVPYAAIVLRDGRTFTAGEERRLPLDRLPLTSAGVDVGSLVLSARSASERFSGQEQRLIDQLAAQAAAAIRLAELVEETRTSRERLVAKVAAEREQVRRDLHDEIGPRLAGVAYLLHAVPDGSPALFQARHELESAIADVRRVAHGMRPSILERVGLATALTQRAAELSSGTALAVTVDVAKPEDTELNDVVEVALYRIAMEALTNVARHAAAERCEIRLGFHGREACLEISDDGAGFRAEATPGLGLASMRKRAADLGGTCEVRSRPEVVGTCVRVTVPCHA